MLIVWSGWGVLVPVINFVAFALFAACMKAIDSTSLEPTAHLAAIIANAVVWAGLASGAIFLIAERLGARPGRTLVDPATQQRVVLRKSAGSFFFIPTRYWAFITVALWAFITVALWALFVGSTIMNGGRMP
jgi:hypothetical protein